MRPKVIVSNKNKDTVTIYKLGDTFLGNWQKIKEYTIVMKYNINMSKKKHCARAKPFTKMEMIDELENIDLTPRLVTSVLASQYDPLGLNSS